MSATPLFLNFTVCVVHVLVVQLQSGPGDQRDFKRNPTPPPLPTIPPQGTAGLLTHGAEVAVSAVTGNACLHVLKILCVCVCVRERYADVCDHSVQAETLQPVHVYFHQTTNSSPFTKVFVAYCLSLLYKFDCVHAEVICNQLSAS